MISPSFSIKTTLALLAFIFLVAHAAYAENLKPTASNRDPFSKILKQQTSQNKLDYNLEQFPCTLLRLAGVLQQGPTVRAILFDPNGQLHQVKIGEIVGLEKAKITAIFTDKVLLSTLSKNNQPITISLNLP